MWTTLPLELTGILSLKVRDYKTVLCPGPVFYTYEKEFSREARIEDLQSTNVK